MSEFAFSSINVHNKRNIKFLPLQVCLQNYKFISLKGFPWRLFIIIKIQTLRQAQMGTKKTNIFEDTASSQRYQIGKQKYCV